MASKKYLHTKNVWISLLDIKISNKWHYVKGAQSWVKKFCDNILQYEKIQDFLLDKMAIFGNKNNTFRIIVVIVLVSLSAYSWFFFGSLVHTLGLCSFGKNLIKKRFIIQNNLLKPISVTIKWSYLKKKNPL